MLKDDIDKACTVIEQKIVPRYLDEYFLRLYLFSNENLAGYLYGNKYRNRRALTVGSSADQVLNLINYNCQDITLVDINPFVKYYYELKKAAIFGLNRDEYLKFFTDNRTFIKAFNPTFSRQTYNKIKKYLSEEGKIFWDSLFEIFDPVIIKKNLFMSSGLSKGNLIKNNDYLGENDFRELRRKIERSKITFNVDDIDKRNLTYSQYDYIFLSNVFDYLFNLTVKTEEEIEEILKTEYLSLLLDLTNLLTKKGILYFQYLWGIDNIENNYYYLFKQVFKNYQNIRKINFSGANHFPDEIDCVYIYKKRR